MASGMPAQQASCLGATSNLTVAAAGNNSQASATILTADYNLITTSGASTNSVLLPSAAAQCEVCIAVASAQTTVNIFPNGTETIIDEGAQGAGGAAVTLAASKNAVFHPHRNFWVMIRGA